jgi:hypothetical protein
MVRQALMKHRVLDTKALAEIDFKSLGICNRERTMIRNIFVINQYKDGNVVKSTMKDSKGHTIYEVEYSKGKILRTRNYDSKAKMTIEQTFYDNGQVHYRNEYTSKGKITTEFDINGKKK